MMYTLAEAAKATGKSKSTILRSINSKKVESLSGKKDAHGNWTIEPSELHRLYPAVSSDAVRDAPDDAPRTGHDAPEIALKLAMAEKERDAAERLADERAKTIDDLRSRLDTEGEERRKLTAMLTDQRPKGFWARLTGR